MADYYPLIARAIAGLDPSAPGESRRALYERARTALIAQLRSVQPPLSESEITRERLSLEEAVRKVESEAAQRAREASRPGGGAAAARRRRLPPRQCPSAGRRTSRGLRPPRVLAPRPRPPGQPPSRDARPPLGQEEQRPPRNLRPDAPPPGAPRPQPPQIPMQDADLPPTRERSGGARRGPDNGAPQMPPHRRACAASATSPPTPTISAAPRRRPTARREKPMPTCRRPRRNSTGSSRAWKTAAPIPRRPIPTRNRWRRPTATRRSRRRCRRRVSVRGCPGIATANRRSPSTVGGRVSVQERDRGRHRAYSGRRRHPVGQVGRDRRSAACSNPRPSVEAPKDPAAPQSRPKIPDRVGQPSSSDNVAPGGAARGAV